MKKLQSDISMQNFRLYRTSDVIGVELGGALKNIIAIACGVAIGAGQGDSARAALMTRGFSEMVSFAKANGAKEKTLSGLSGLGDLSQLVIHKSLVTLFLAYLLVVKKLSTKAQL